MSQVDCVVIGYNEGDFQQYRMMCERAGEGTPEWQIYRKEHLVVDGRAMPWMEAFSTLRNARTGRADRYHVGEVFNLASLYLTSFLRQRGIRTEAISLFGAEQTQLAELLAGNPAVVAITTTFYVNVISVVPIVEFVRQHSPASHIVVGGPLIDNLCMDGFGEDVQDLLHAMGADTYIQESQGEQTLSELCHAVMTGNPVTEIANVIHQPEGDWVRTRRRPESNVLDECVIDWSGFTSEQLGVTAQTRTARSCAFACSFCDYPTRAGTLSTASVDAVRHELRALAARGVQNLVFVDDTFNVPPKRFKELCQMMIEEDLGLNWYSYFRCSNARDDETFDLVAASGCKGVFLGIESGDSQILANMNKLAQNEQYRAGIRRLKERGITTFASIIVGFPGENDETMKNTIDFVNETAPTFWRAQPWWGNPRSPIYSKREVYGIEGAAYDWSHLSMNSREAAAWCDRMFDEVTESVWLPLYDFDFWSLPYLAGKGIGVAELTPLLQTSQELMRVRDQPVPDQARLSLLQEGFARQVAALDVLPPRFSYPA